MNEIWKPISLEGFEGLYEVSNIGRVRSLDREFIKCDGKLQPVKGKVLNQTHDKDGYVKVYFSNQGNENNFSVHRLVAKTFILNPNNLPQVNHINSIRDDNRLENLEWVTAKENSEHAYEYGFGKRGLYHENSRQIALFYKDELLSVFETVTKCSEVLGINRGNLRTYIKGNKLIFQEIDISYFDNEFDINLLNKYPFTRRLHNFQSKPVYISDKENNVLGVYENRLIAERINNFPETILMKYKTTGSLYKNTYFVKDLTQYQYLTYDDNYINIKIQ